MAMAAGPAAGAELLSSRRKPRPRSTVILKSLPVDKKIAVIKVVREVKTGLGLPKPRAGRGAPKPVLEGANKLMLSCQESSRSRRHRRIEVIQRISQGGELSHCPG